MQHNISNDHIFRPQIWNEITLLKKKKLLFIYHENAYVFIEKKNNKVEIQVLIIAP